MSKKHEPGMAYDMKKLNKIFAIFSLVLLVTVIWVFLDDYMRPWKAIQIEAMKIEKEKIAKDIAEEEAKISAEKVKVLNDELAAAKKSVEAKSKDIAAIEKELNQVIKDIKKEQIVNGRLNSDVAALAFNYGVAHAEHASNAGSLFKKLQEKKDLFAKSTDKKKALQDKEKNLKKQLADFNTDIDAINKQVNGIVGRLELLKGAEKRKEVTPVFALRNLPFIDFMDPTVKVQQVVLENITDDRFFQHVPKVDRCMTCHTFIDKPGYENQPNPHKTHPNLDLMVGANGKHPMKNFGCTSCHGGEGHRVNDFNAAAHMPATEEQKQDWIAKYNWHEPHKVPIVQLRRGDYEAGCVKCHSGVQYIPQATTLNEGRRALEKFGCYACHKIEGWEHKRKPGPSLEKIAAKLDKDFFKNWVWEPKAFNKHAKMPQFFNNDNNNSPEFVKKNIAEVNAIAEVIYAQSESYKPFMKYTGGNKEKGKQLVGEIGCLACHGVKDFALESQKVDAHKGPYLDGIGSKVKDANWMASWLKNPSHFQEDTIMPSFRLSDREVNDITAYLMSLKNNQFEKLKFADMDKGARDEILVTYFSAFDTVEVAKAKLATMSDHERTMELGRRSIGKYGCYSCHNIKGFEDRAPIGPELSKIGSKPLTQFGFSHEKVEHSREAWIKAHLLNPRRWDNGVDKPFKDLLRMPQFHMSEKDAALITTALIGQVDQKIPLKGVKRYDAAETVANEGMKVAVKFNCIGCHQIDGEFGDMLKIYDDVNEAPPRLVEEGHRVQADWFHYFLGDVYEIRPWLKLRMPSFNMSKEEKEKLVDMFRVKADQPIFDENEKVVWESNEERRAAVKLFNDLACASCHTTGFNSDPALAPDLHFAKRRLRKSWIKKWLEGPDKIMPGTTMPSFWPEGEAADPELLDGDAKRQIEAVTKYVLELGSDFYSPKAKKAGKR
ncbi:MULTISPECIES: c-type cytochrome [unclassified Halobacteriovorax]|uniref:c-type cytochrome n=1 Tax=unclassified Halobacteriovorax TaxID=2639665 RepID=UPI0039999FD2